MNFFLNVSSKFLRKTKKQQKNQKLAGYIWIHLDTSKPDVSRSVLNDSYTKITSLVFSKNWLDTSGYIWIHLDTSGYIHFLQNHAKIKIWFFFLDTSGYIWIHPFFCKITQKSKFGIVFRKMQTKRSDTSKHIE